MPTTIEQKTLIDEASVKVVDADDVKLSVKTWGNPYAPTVILVHGYPDSSEVWYPIVELLRHRFHVVTYDVRGTGQSSTPTGMGAYSLTKLSDDLQAVMRQVCPTQPVHLVGHDWGSIQTWESVTNPNLKPRIASFTSISGPCLDHVSHWIRNGLANGTAKKRMAVLSQLAHSWYVAAFQLPLLAPSFWRLGLDKVWPKIVSKMEGQAIAKNPTQRRDGVNGINLYRANMLPKLGAPRERYTEVPVQLLVPKKDSFVTASLITATYPWVKDLWRREMDAGHWVVASDADYVANCISEFVDFVQEKRETPSLARARVTNLERNTA